MPTKSRKKEAVTRKPAAKPKGRKANGSKSDTRARILDIAEIEFSERGYRATSLRMISEAHHINLGLIHYYFGSKEGLFSAVFMRRSKALVEKRAVLLDAARERHGTKPIPVEEIVRCFIVPTAEMLKEGRGPKAYIRLQGLLRYDPMNFGRKLRGEAFTTTNKRFIEEISRSCPHLPRAAVVWRFAAMAGAYYSMILQSSRVEELSDGLCDSSDIDHAIHEVTPFVVGGFETSRTGPSSSSKAKKR